MLEGLRRARKDEAVAHNALLTRVTIREQLKAAETKVEQCNQRLIAADKEIASWAMKHDLHFDGEGAIASWPPQQIEEFKVLNFRRNEVWNEFQSSLAAYAELKERAQA